VDALERKKLLCLGVDLQQSGRKLTVRPLWGCFGHRENETKADKNKVTWARAIFPNNPRQGQFLLDKGTVTFPSAFVAQGKNRELHFSGQLDTRRTKSAVIDGTFCQCILCVFGLCALSLRRDEGKLERKAPFPVLWWSWDREKLLDASESNLKIASRIHKRQREKLSVKRND